MTCMIVPFRAASWAVIALVSAGSPAAAQTISAEPQEAEKPDEIVVSGRRVSVSSEAIGENRVTNTVAVTREALLSAPSGISGLKMLETLPGFNVQTDGALGLYEFGNSVQTRAFNLDQIGFLIDDIPTGRSDAFGGSPIFRYVDNENLAAVVASPGAGDVSLATYSSLGPIIRYRSIAPQDDLGLFVSQTFGDNNLRRTFVRASSGQVGPLRAYVSRTKLDTDLWRGEGTVSREHWEAQVYADLGGSSWARFKFVSNDFFDYDSPSLSRADYLSATPDAGGKTGRDRGYIANVVNYPALATAPTIRYSDPRYAYVYNLAINIRNDRLYGGTFHLGMTDNVYAEFTGYWEDKSGYGVSPDAYANSLTRFVQQNALGQAVVAPRGIQFGKSGVGGDRYGLLGSIHAAVGAQTIQAGYWAELDKYHRTQLRYNTIGGAPDGAQIESEVVYRRRDYNSRRDTLQLFLKDTVTLLDEKLVVELGVKSLSVDYRQQGYRDFNDYARVVGGVAVAGWGPQLNTAAYKDHFLPMAGAVYKIGGRSQVFASYAENYALPKGMDDIYAVALNSSAALVPQPAAEKARNYEVGVRTNQREFYAALAGYFTTFDNRIQSFSNILPGTTNVTETFFQNVGSVEAYGAEFAGSYKPAFLNDLAYVNMNVTYNEAKFKDDVPGVATIKGKTIPDSARWIVGGGLTIEPASWLVANISGKYTSRRYANFTNTFSVPAFTVFSAYVDIGDGFSIGPVKGVKARVNVDNLFDRDVLSFITPSVATDGFFRPLSPRMIQFTLSAEL